MRRSSFGECFLQRGKSMCKGLVTIKNITDSRIWKQANMTGVKRWRERAKQIVLESVSDFRESSGSLLSSVLCLGVQLSSEQSKITKLQIARRSASSFKTISGHYKEWFGREKKDVEERPAKRLLWRSWREAVGSDIRWYWCKRVEPDGAKSWDSARGCTTSKSELRSCQGWMDGEMGKTKNGSGLVGKPCIQFQTCGIWGSWSTKIFQAFSFLKWFPFPSFWCDTPVHSWKPSSGVTISLSLPSGSIHHFFCITSI